MNLAQTVTLHPHLLDEEAHVVENAIRLAMDSILNVLYGVNSARTREYNRLLGDRDKEIQRLECRLREIEHELQVLRRQGCTCGSPVGSQSRSDRGDREQSGLEPDCMDSEGMTGPQECEMSISLGLFSRPPSHMSSQSHELALPSSPSGMGLDQTCTSRSSEVSGVSEMARNFSTSPSGLIVKEEPYDMDAVMIKWEVSEERFGEQQEIRGSPCHDREGQTIKGCFNKKRTKLSEKSQVEPGGHKLPDEVHLRDKKRPVPMSELPEEAQRLKRAAWRAASKRYYARKIARQQANPSLSIPTPHIPVSQYPQHISLLNKRKRSLISELPEESQMLQREAWRAASRRYYARKLARPRPDATQFGLLLQSKKLSGRNTGT